jgi:PAS domain S-box-containing protein
MPERGPGAGRFELLAAVAEVADGSLSLGMTVTRLLEIVVPAFADLALLDAVGPEGGLRRLGARVQGPGSAELEAAVRQRQRGTDPSVGVAQVAVQGESQLLSPVTEVDLRAIAGSEEDLELLRSLQLRSALFVPLRARGRILGALACGVGTSGRHYEPEDVRFAEVLAGRISLALDNAGLSEMVGALEQQLESTLANLAEAVLVRDATGRMVFANAAVVSLLGFESLADMRSAGSERLMELFEAFDEHGRTLQLSDLPSAAAMRGERAEPLLVRSLDRRSGLERWLLHKATPVLDQDGQVSLIVNVIEDLTDVKRAELGQRLLAEAGKELASSLDYEQTLQRVAALAVPQLADWCGVRIRGPDDQLEQVAVAHVDPQKVALAREFGERYPSHLSDNSATAVVARSGESRLIREITQEMIDRAEASEEQRAIVGDLKMRSVIIVPLAVPGRAPLGAMSLVMAESGRLFEQRDLELAEELARRAAAAVENARLYTERSRIATTLQRSLLPEELPAIDGFRLASLYRAAGEESEVGGDFYDAFEIPSGWVVLVGDVTGRGPEAAALTSLSRYTLRAAARLLDDPLAAIEQLNDELRERQTPSLVTVGCALLTHGPDTRVILAGHPPPFHITRGVPRQVGSFGPPLGAYQDGQWGLETIELEPGDQLVLYTDGVTDTVGRGERFGEDRLAETLLGATGAAETIRRIDEALRGFAHGSQADDTAVLAVERIAASAADDPDDALVVEGAG